MQRTDRCELTPRAEPHRLQVAPAPCNDEVSYVTPAARNSRAQQLEAENRRLRELVGDLMLETEILRATLRRYAPETGAVAIR
ncbi:hypothetical protein [Phenylobacterium sp.]|uniref:hypothetical protein n=1 Tax=Phenylobacterium sp. TaxID=1871053 RepID=UPI0035B430E0